MIFWLKVFVAFACFIGIPLFGLAIVYGPPPKALAILGLVTSVFYVVGGSYLVRREQSGNKN
jgi:hypothetical protein